MHSSCWQHPGSGILLCLLLCAQQSAGQAKPSPQLSRPQAETLTQATIPMLDEGKGLIHLDVSVANADGEPVSGLNRDDFDLLDEGRPQKISSFHAFDGESAGPDPPVQLILFVDTFGLAIDEASRVQVSVEEFLRQNSGELAVPVSIFRFSEDGLWMAPHHETTDGNLLAADLAQDIRIVLTRKADVLRALGTIATGQRKKSGRKLLLWIGPGCGPGSGVSPATGLFRQTTGLFPAAGNGGQKIFGRIVWFTALLREARLSIDELSVDQEGVCTNGYQQYLSGPQAVRDASDRFLYKKVLSIQSGGSVVDEGRDLVTEISLRVQHARRFYTLSFDPPVTSQAHEYHSLQVRVHRPGLLARTNTGYYDEPAFSDQPNPAIRRVTVEQLDQILSETDSRGGDDRAEKLSKLELMERLSLEELSGWAAKYQNRNVQQVLVGVADASAFLDPPHGEIPKRGAPDAAAQQQMLALVKDYLEKTLRKLPNFYATRTTARYEEMPQPEDGKTSGEGRPLRVVELSKARVLYRDGGEVVESRDPGRGDSTERRLTTQGTFGPILAEVRRAVETPGRMQWVRWESGPEGRRAVFGFEATAAESRYFEGGCCLPDGDGENSFRIQAGYREEVEINPENGTILRLLQKFDMHEYVPMDRDEVLIDYGPVSIGGKMYVCPIRSVSLARGRSIMSLREGDQSFLSFGPYSTKMNDMRFSNYHVFRADALILPDSAADK